MLAMLQLLARHQHIEELAGMPQEAQEQTRQSQEAVNVEKAKIGGEVRKTSAPDACFKAALKLSLSECRRPLICRN